MTASGIGLTDRSCVVDRPLHQLVVREGRGVRVSMGRPPEGRLVVQDVHPDASLAVLLIFLPDRLHPLLHEVGCDRHIGPRLGPGRDLLSRLVLAVTRVRTVLVRALLRAEDGHRERRAGLVLGDPANQGDRDGARHPVRVVVLEKIAIRFDVEVFVKPVFPGVPRVDLPVVRRHRIAAPAAHRRAEQPLSGLPLGVIRRVVRDAVDHRAYLLRLGAAIDGQGDLRELRRVVRGRGRRPARGLRESDLVDQHPIAADRPEDVKDESFEVEPVRIELRHGHEHLAPTVRLDGVVVGRDVHLGEGGAGARLEPDLLELGFARGNLHVEDDAAVVTGQARLREHPPAPVVESNARDPGVHLVRRPAPVLPAVDESAVVHHLGDFRSRR